MRAGDSVTVHPAIVPKAAEPEGEAIPLDIIYEDDALIALNKQPGLVVHPAAGHWSGTLVNALIHHCGAQLAGRGGQERLGIVHRLDKDTSGLMLVAKTDEVHERLARAFADREVKKIYRALCRGVFRRASGECQRRDRSASRPSQENDACRKIRSGAARRGTDYRVLKQGKQGAEVECLLHTGRTHQIRVAPLASGASDLGRHALWPARAARRFLSRAPNAARGADRDCASADGEAAAARGEVAGGLCGKPRNFTGGSDSVLTQNLPVGLFSQRKKRCGVYSPRFSLARSLAACQNRRRGPCFDRAGYDRG